MIILDLEWNRGYDKLPLEEILQIGAVRLDGPGGVIKDTFNVYIRPRVHAKLDPMAKALPDIQRSRQSEVDFAAALDAFCRWCGEETVFAAWGGGDAEVLNKSCAHWKLPPFPMETVYDFQAAFSRMLGTSQQAALNRAVDYCCVPDTFVYHNALHDAVYTAMVGAWMGEGALAVQALPKKVRVFATEPFPPQPRRRVGPFPSLEAALDNPNSRCPVCPVCGRKIWVLHWYACGTQQYFSEVTCPEHGTFLCRLSLSPTEDGALCGRLSVPAITPELLREFDRAANRRAHNCKRTGRKKKHRWYPRRQTEVRAG